VREVLSAVERVHGRPIKTIESPRRAGDPPSLIAKVQRVREALQWTPRYDDIKAIVQSQLDWEHRLLREPGLQRN